MDYMEFVTACCKDLKVKQNELNTKYDLNSYSNWFYDQASGILTFSDGDKELNFRYYEVGTYSKVSKTWKWSWYNEHTLKKVKKGLDIIKNYGQKHSFDSLTNGLFESSDEQGWDFTSIALKLLNGIGSYRPETEKYLIFMVLYEIIENQTAKEEKKKYVNCGDHDRCRRAFICQHLERGSNNGFEEAFETYEDMELEFEDDDFQAWCNDCEKVRLQNDGWNDTSMEFANIKLICEKCYFEIKETNK